MDYFGARYYGNWLGRFVTPDWAAKPATVPYGDLKDPQSLNLYSYVRNRPTTLVDLDGHKDASCPNNSTGCSVTTTNNKSTYSTDDRVYVYVTETTTVKYNDENGRQVEKSDTTETQLVYSKDSGKQGTFLGASQLSFSSTTVKAYDEENMYHEKVISASSSYEQAKWQPANINAAQALKMIGPDMVSKMLDDVRPSVLWGMVPAALDDADKHPGYYVAAVLGPAAIPIGAGSVVAGAVLTTAGAVAAIVDKVSE